MRNGMKLPKRLPGQWCYHGKIYMIKKSTLRFACYIVITYSLSIKFSEIRWTVKWQVPPNHSFFILHGKTRRVKYIDTHWCINKSIEIYDLTIWNQINFTTIEHNVEVKYDKIFPEILMSLLWLMNIHDYFW
jgi:hypothetical protein